jgi:hypothetical protein
MGPVSIGEDEKVLEENGGDSWKSTQLFLMPLTCTLKRL